MSQNYQILGNVENEINSVFKEAEIYNNLESFNFYYSELKNVNLFIFLFR